MKVTSLIALLLSFQFADAQILFHKTYPTATEDVAECLKATPNGYLISGDRILSTDLNGNELLTIPGVHNRAAFVPSDNGFIAAQFGPGASSVDGHVLRYTETGALIWDQEMEIAVWLNSVKDVIPTSDGMFIYVGRHGDVTGMGAVIRKLCPGGIPIWHKVWNLDMTFTTHALELFPTTDEIYVTGVADAGVNGSDAKRDLALTKHDYGNGELMYSYVFSDDSTQHPRDILVRDGGELLLVGFTSDGVGTRGLLISVNDQDSLFSENWIETFPTTHREHFNAIEATSDGGLLILGNRFLTDSTISFVKKLDASLTEEWEYVFENEGVNHIAVEMVSDSADTYTVAGHYSDAASGTENYFLTRFDITSLNNPVSVGLEPIAPAEIELYPNPVADRLFIDIPGNTEAIASIYDLQGKRVDQLVLRGSNASYNCEHLDRGIYLLELRSGATRRIAKFTVN